MEVVPEELVLLLLEVVVVVLPDVVPEAVPEVRDVVGLEVEVAEIEDISGAVDPVQIRRGK